MDYRFIKYCSYDIYIKDSTGRSKTHVCQLLGNFTSNSFTKDNFLVGLEYGWKDIVMVRAGMVTEKGIFKGERKSNNCVLQVHLVGNNRNSFWREKNQLLVSIILTVLQIHLEEFTLLS